MDKEEFLQNLLSQFVVQPSAGPEDDYRNFLANYMHAQNQGVRDEELHPLLNALGPDRLKAMQQFAGAYDPTNIDRDQHVRAARSNLMQLLSSVSPK